MSIGITCVLLILFFSVALIRKREARERMVMIVFMGFVLLAMLPMFLKFIGYPYVIFISVVICFAAAVFLVLGKDRSFLMRSEELFLDRGYHDLSNDVSESIPKGSYQDISTPLLLEIEKNFHMENLISTDEDSSIESKVADQIAESVEEDLDPEQEIHLIKEDNRIEETNEALDSDSSAQMVKEAEQKDHSTEQEHFEKIEAKQQEKAEVILAEAESKEQAVEVVDETIFQEPASKAQEVPVISEESKVGNQAMDKISEEPQFEKEQDKEVSQEDKPQEQEKQQVQQTVVEESKSSLESEPVLLQELQKSDISPEAENMNKMEDTVIEELENLDEDSFEKKFMNFVQNNSLRDDSEEDLKPYDMVEEKFQQKETSFEDLLAELQPKDLLTFAEEQILEEPDSQQESLALETSKEESSEDLVDPPVLEKQGGAFEEKFANFVQNNGSSLDMDKEIRQEEQSPDVLGELFRKEGSKKNQYSSPKGILDTTRKGKPSWKNNLLEAQEKKRTPSEMEEIVLDDFSKTESGLKSKEEQKKAEEKTQPEKIQERKKGEIKEDRSQYEAEKKSKSDQELLEKRTSEMEEVVLEEKEAPKKEIGKKVKKKLFNRKKKTDDQEVSKKEMRTEKKVLKSDPAVKEKEQKEDAVKLESEVVQQKEEALNDLFNRRPPSEMEELKEETLESKPKDVKDPKDKAFASSFAERDRLKETLDKKEKEVLSQVSQGEQSSEEKERISENYFDEFGFEKDPFFEKLEDYIRKNTQARSEYPEEGDDFLGKSSPFQEQYSMDMISMEKLEEDVQENIDHSSEVQSVESQNLIRNERQQDEPPIQEELMPPIEFAEKENKMETITVEIEEESSADTFREEEIPEDELYVSQEHQMETITVEIEEENELEIPDEVADQLFEEELYEEDPTMETIIVEMEEDSKMDNDSVTIETDQYEAEFFYDDLDDDVEGCAMEEFVAKIEEDPLEKEAPEEVCGMESLSVEETPSNNTRSISKVFSKVIFQQAMNDIQDGETEQAVEKLSNLAIHSSDEDIMISAYIELRNLLGRDENMREITRKVLTNQQNSNNVYLDIIKKHMKDVI